MIPASSMWCVTCGHRYDDAPQYCHTRIAWGTELLERACPGPLIQLFVDEPAPPMLAEMDIEVTA